ncbi:MAG: class I SAM-dependent methyltransferase [Chloroflexi bacterium]|nr:class I SAM-dependent methyltransferase [Chloroflexota bacterium]
MSDVNLFSPSRKESYGERSLTIVDRFGIYLSRREILRNLPGHTQLSALDLGCGYHATHLRAIYSSLSSGVGIDVRVSDECKRIPRLKFLEGDIESLLSTLSGAEFDVVLLISVLEHLTETIHVLAECHRVMRPGAVLLINVPTWRGKTLLEFSAFRLGKSPACEMDDHKMYFDKRDLWPVLVKAGFKPSRIRLNYHKFGLNLFSVVTK